MSTQIASVFFFIHGSHGPFNPEQVAAHIADFPPERQDLVFEEIAVHLPFEERMELTAFASRFPSGRLSEAFVHLLAVEACRQGKTMEAVLQQATYARSIAHLFPPHARLYC
ncbi:hypothetical protein COU17_01365 [Candidatus Kaiserbacteria bacterium CG10_big_fil_rev_8_21_14_0_10_49_17]|uniref:Uncharacterized protein n=1 Tax=Candidatus Kaiserbacteria bacterium CG10_big_fil_rev_8_21_14_0_10_49_17 TaxID=1974609 RepID=A0A2M6WEP5_9BACT|nr:MAG: hypothetical protein COU17_01365 [Candidatus Kaiserbacteria bacterium CG10_big_fil_rev_8_21_14_0_10_49_17]